MPHSLICLNSFSLLGKFSAINFVNSFLKCLFILYFFIDCYQLCNFFFKSRKNSLRERKADGSPESELPNDLVSQGCFAEQSHQELR